MCQRPGTLSTSTGLVCSIVSPQRLTLCGRKPDVLRQLRHAGSIWQVLFSMWSADITRGSRRFASCITIAAGSDLHSTTGLAPANFFATTTTATSTGLSSKLLGTPAAPRACAWKLQGSTPPDKRTGGR